MFEDGFSTNQLALKPYQQAQVSLATGTGGFWLSSAEARTLSASVGSLVATVSEVFADMSGAKEEEVREKLPDSGLVRRIWNSVRDLCNVMGLQRKPRRTSSGKLAGQSL